MKFTIRDQRNGNWYWISRIIYQDYISNIGVIGLALYNAYASYAFDEQEVYPSQKTIAKKLSISIPTLIKYNKKLIKHKLIHIHTQDGMVNTITLLKIRPLNEVNTNKKKRIRKREEHVRLITNVKKTFDEIHAKKLSSIIIKGSKMSRKVGMKRWTKEIRLLRSTQKIKKIRIKEVIKWLVHYANDEYTPKIYKASDFREKFSRIEDAMERMNKKTGEGQTPTRYKVTYDKS